MRRPSVLQVLTRLRSRPAVFVSAIIAGSLALGGVAFADSPEADFFPPIADNPANSPILAGHEELLASSEDEVLGEIAVDLKDDATQADIEDIDRTYGVVLHANSAWSDAHDKLELARVGASDEAALLDRLSHDPRVTHAERMEVFRASFVPDDPLYSKQWHLTRAGAEQAWEYACGEGVTVAVIDTGVACFDKGPFTRGTDLGGTRCGGGYNFVNDSPEAYDDQGHGTHVAGTVAQTTNNGKGVAGMAFCARLMPVKVLNRFGWGTLADVAEGIRFAADNGAQVINLSLGGDGRSAILEDAVDHALGKGVVVVAAAGNSGRSVGYPAAYDGVIAVSATDSNDNIAWFSSRGPQIAIAAPGVGVTQQTICNGGKNKCEIFGTFSGTSMASPHVAGAAAMMVGMGVSGPDAVRAALAKSATPKDDAKLYGAGLLDAGASASRVFWTHLGLRVGALFVLGLLVARRIRKHSGEVTRGKGVVFGALLGGVGLLPFLPLLKLASRFGSMRWVAELLMRPFGEWDIIFDAGLHRWLLLASALPAVAITALLFSVKRIRPVLGGFALGSAALLVQLAVSAEVATPFGSFATRAWTVVNALVCLWIARIALDKKRA